jgi:sulfite reductase (ferredoxin)
MITWKEKLGGSLPEDLAEEIDAYETQMQLKRQGKIEDRIFGETRLRRGVYGQRYDNGRRHDGVNWQTINFPDETTKGVETVYDAPGMQRIKIPFGGLTADQIDVLADIAEEYSDAISHITTRQDFQFHFVHIDDTPAMHRRLAACGITTREACGNTVRNVTACPLAGVCRDETFDVTPYADAQTQFLLGHPDAQDFGRKFKIAFSGCQQHACGLTTMHDMGFIARTREVDGKEVRGFETYVGGGLGAVPQKAKLYEEFVPAEEILPLAQAMARVFARLGEKKNRARARIKFLIQKLGLEEFKRLVEEERKILPHDDRWAGMVADAGDWKETPLFDAAPQNGSARPEGFDRWYETNVYQQRQEGYAVVTVSCPLGDLTSRQMRRVADIAREYVGDNVRTTVEQNVLFRWVREADLVAIYEKLVDVGLGASGAGTIVDITACPGTDTCKLGIASSRGLAAELREHLAAKSHNLDEAIQSFRIKISGCFNSCGQHHISDIGFYGVSRKIGGTTVPHFQVVLGGKWQENAASYGLAIGAVPSKKIPQFLDAITDQYVADREKGESFQDYIARVGKKELKKLLNAHSDVPPYEEDRTCYSDWRDPREFTIADLGQGECAGEVVERIDFDLQAAERVAFEAQCLLDDGSFEAADQRAYQAMLDAARALVKLQYHDVSDDPAMVIAEFKSRFYDTELFFDKFAGGKFANYLFKRHDEQGDRAYNSEAAHHLVEESQLFIEAAHTCHGRLLEEGVAPQISI